MPWAPRMTALPAGLAYWIDRTHPPQFRSEH
jgi:hypothetical protein